MNTSTNRFTPPPSVIAQIARLPQLLMAEIKALWQQLFGRDNPTHNRQFLERRIAYKLQEIEFRTVDPQLLERNARRIQALIETGTPWFTRKKNGRLYRYYLPVRDNKEYAGASGLPRLPAAELEAAVLEQMRRVLRAPEMVAGVTEHATRLDPYLDEAQVTVAMTRLEVIWEQLFPAEQQRIVRLLIEKVIVSPRDLEVRFRANGIEVLALELQPEPTAENVEEAVA